jgi:molecular chaperone GrpE (heat shock protein)
MESNPSATPFRLVEYANDLYRVSQNQYPEIVSTLNSVGSTIVSNALKGSNQGTHEFLGRAIKKQIDEATSDLVAERDKFHAACAALKSQTEVAEREVTRLKNLVDMLKSSVSQAKEDVELNVSAEVVRPFILLLDDFERQANGDRQPSFEALLGQLRNAIDRAGVERMGTTNSCESFDPSRHELLEESDGSFSRVRIVRSGYRFRSETKGSVIRRALVKPERDGTK